MNTDSRRDNLSQDAARRHLVPLQEYKTIARRLFPALERWDLDGYSISSADALFLGYFLEYGPQQALALVIGADTGASTLCFASHPKIGRVINFNPNPTVAEELADRSDPQTVDETNDPDKYLKVLDVAKAVVGECPEEMKKVSFFEGKELAEAIGDMQLPDPGSPQEDGVVVFVEGFQAREHISESLRVVFDRSPRAVVFMDYRLSGGRPSVQAGIADFMDQAEDRYRFRMASGLGPAFAGCNLGVLYPETSAGTEKILGHVSREFSLKLDPLRLLGREEELMNTVSRLNRQLSQTVEEKEQLKIQAEKFQGRIVHLEARIENQRNRNETLLSQYSRLRYRAANATAEGLLKLPGLRGLLTRAVSLYRKNK